MLAQLQKILHAALDKPGLAALLLRIGLAVIFLYAATASFIDPREWVGYLPAVLTNWFSAKALLTIFSIYELLLAAWLLSGVYTRYAALLAAATLSGIILTNFELFMITFRDVALVFTALALATLSKE